MATESGRKESFRRPNILRKHSPGEQKSNRNVKIVKLEFVSGCKDVKEMSIADLSMVIESKHELCRKAVHRNKNITLDSYLCDEYKKRKQISALSSPVMESTLDLNDDIVVSNDVRSLLRNDMRESEQSAVKINYIISTDSNIPKDGCQSSAWNQPLNDNRTLLGNITFIKDEWMETGRKSSSEDSSAPFLQLNSNPQLSQLHQELSIGMCVDAAGTRAIMCPWPLCGRTFRQPCRLREHCRAHTGARPYRCREEGCRAAFRSASKLRRHVTGGSHEAQRRHACPWPACGRAFLRADHLRQHMPRHIRPFRPYLTPPLAPASAPPHIPEPPIVGYDHQQPEMQPLEIFHPPTADEIQDDDADEDSSFSRPLDPLLLQWQQHSSLLEEGGCARTHRPWTGISSSSRRIPLRSQQTPSSSDWMSTLDLSFLPDDHLPLHQALLQEDSVSVQSQEQASEQDLVSMEANSLDGGEQHLLLESSGPDPVLPY